MVRRVEVSEPPEVESLVVALGEHDDGGGQSLLFMLGFAFDEQDRRLGQDTYCVTNEVAVSVYGGVTACVLSDHRLILRFASDTAVELGLPEECRFRLDVDGQSIERLRRGLARVFAGGRDTPNPLVL